MLLFLIMLQDFIKKNIFLQKMQKKNEESDTISYLCDNLTRLLIIYSITTELLYIIAC
jgi:hypothetical protein